MSPRVGMSDGLSLRVGCLQDIFIYKASYNALTWLHESGKFIKFQNIAAQDAHWYVINVRA